MEYWLQVAKGLDYGRRTKIVCCGPDPSRLVNHGPKGYSSYCFRCGEPYFEPHGVVSIAELQRRQAAVQNFQRASTSLPADFTTDIPDEHAVWLYKAGIPSRLVRWYGFGFSPSLRRVILPIYREGKLDSVLARSTTGDKPKYVARMSDPYRAVFLSDPRTVSDAGTLRPVHRSPHICITEDVLSAVRVGCVVPSAALLGTSVSDGQLERILHAALQMAVDSGDDVARVVVWTDYDRAGRQASARICRELRLRGVETSVVCTVKDPKLYSSREIRSYLDDRRDPATDHARTEGIQQATADDPARDAGA